MPPKLAENSQQPSESQHSFSVLSGLRLWTFSASLTPVILGASLSYRAHGNFNLVLFFLTLGAVLAVNGAGNMVNSYFDHMRKVNSVLMRKISGNKTNQQSSKGNGTLKKRDSDSRKERTLVSDDDDDKDDDKALTPTLGDSLAHTQLYQASLVNYAAGMYGFGMLCMLLLMTLSTAKSEFIAALFFGGLSSSFIYTGGIGLKYYILGDLLVVFTFGPLSVLFSYGIQTGVFPFGPLFLALPLSLSTEAILHSKHLREAKEDKKEGVISLAVLLGKQGSYFLFTLLLFLPYLFFAVLATQYSLFLGLPLLSMPFSFQLERKLREEGPSKTISVRAAKLNAAVSLLYIFGCLLARNIPFIEV